MLSGLLLAATVSNTEFDANHLQTQKEAEGPSIYDVQIFYFKPLYKVNDINDAG